MENTYKPFNSRPWLVLFALALLAAAAFAVVGGGGFPTNPMQCNRLLWHTTLAGMDPEDPQNGYQMAASASGCLFPNTASWDLVSDALLLSGASSTGGSYGLDPLAPGRPDHPTLQWLRSGSFGESGDFKGLPQGFFGDYNLRLISMQLDIEGEIHAYFVVDSLDGKSVASVLVSNAEGKTGRRLTATLMNDFPELTPGFGAKLQQVADAFIQGIANITGFGYQSEVYLMTAASRASFSAGPGGIDGFMQAFGFTRIPDKPGGVPAGVKYISPKP